MGKSVVLLIFCMYFVLINGRSFMNSNNSQCKNNGILDDDGICQCPENFNGQLCSYKKTRECFSFDEELEFCLNNDDLNSVMRVIKFPECNDYCLFLKHESNEKKKFSTAQQDKITTTTENSITLESKTDKINEILEQNGCPFEPPLSKNAKHIRLVSDSTTKYKVQCFPGFSFTDGSTVQYIKCRDGKWGHQWSGEFGAPNCYEVHKAFSSKIWATTTTEKIHTENSNEILEPNGCPPEPPLTENAKHIRFYSDRKIKFKVQCFPGYSFADGSKEQNLECGDGKWYHKESGQFKIPFCQVIQREHDDGYLEVRPGKEFLELCIWHGKTWNCSLAAEGDIQKYPSSSDFNTQCAENPNSCKVKTSNCIESSEKHSNMNNMENLMELIKKALGLQAEKQRQQNNKDSKFFSALVGQNNIPGVKIISINFQSVEIPGDSHRKEEKVLQ